MSDFHVTVLSQADLTEFPKNIANSFKNRLAQTLFLDGDGWMVGLASISLPDSQVSLAPLLEGHRGDHLLALTWYYRTVGKEDDGQTDRQIYSGIQKENVWVKDVENDESIVDGISFMKAIISKAEAFRVKSYTWGYHLDDEDGDDLFIKFNWQTNDDLLINNQYASRKSNYPAVRFSRELAKKMRWIRWLPDTKPDAKPTDGKWVLGKNLKMEYFDGHARGLEQPQDLDAGTVAKPKPVYWFVDDWSVRLSIWVNWRFVNLNSAFTRVIGTSTRTFHVYSDVCASSLMGNSIKDLLREIRYKREGRGAIYFEPLHIQYIPVRNNIVETIATEVAESETGALVKFGKGEGILTLHFKKADTK